MEVKDTGQEEMDMGFTPVPDGTYVWQIMEDIELGASEDSDAKTFKVPLQVDSIVDGDSDAVGMSANMYINVIKKDGDENPAGGKTITNILSRVGLVDSFVKNFKKEFGQKDGSLKIPPDNEKFVNALILKLPGNFLRLTHNIQTDENTGRKNTNWTKMASIKKKKLSTKDEETDDDKPNDPDDSDENGWVD